MFGTSPIELMASDAMLQGLIFCESFSYSSSWLTGTNSALAASVSVDQQLQINSDSDFVIQEMNFVSWSALDTIIANPDYLLNINLAGAGRNIFDSPQDIVNVCGNFASNKIPGRMPFPRLLQANSTITNTLTNRTVTASNRAKLTFRGFKIFYLTGNRQAVFHAM